MEDKFYMAGTEGTGMYVVVAVTPRGRVGYRDLGDCIRVRVEPATAEAAEHMAPNLPITEWKQPEEHGQFRFSRVVGGEEGVKAALRQGLEAIGAVGAPPDDLSMNPDAPEWARALILP